MPSTLPFALGRALRVTACSAVQCSTVPCSAGACHAKVSAGRAQCAFRVQFSLSLRHRSVLDGDGPAQSRLDAVKLVVQVVDVVRHLCQLWLCSAQRNVQSAHGRPCSGLSLSTRTGPALQSSHAHPPIHPTHRPSPCLAHSRSHAFPLSNIPRYGCVCVRVHACVRACVRASLALNHRRALETLAATPQAQAQLIHCGWRAWSIFLAMRASSASTRALPDRCAAAPEAWLALRSKQTNHPTAATAK